MTKKIENEHGHDAIDAKSAAVKDEFEQSRERMHKAAMALTLTEVRSYNMDPAYAVSVVRNAWPRLESWWEKMEAIPGFDAALARQTLHAVQALLWVDARIPRKGQTSQAQLQKAIEARRLLLSAMRPLAERGLLSTAILERASSGTSFLDLGNALMVLTAELVAKWPTIESKTVIDAAEVSEAQQLCLQMIDAGTPRDDTAHASNELEDERARLATLVFDGWTEVRETMRWLRRREGDVDAITPSLYSRGGGGSRSPKSDPVEPQRKEVSPEDDGDGLPQEEPFARK